MYDVKVKKIKSQKHTYISIQEVYITSSFPAACLRLKRGRFEQKEHS